MEEYVEDVIEILDDAFYAAISVSDDGGELQLRGDAVLEAEATGLTVRVFLEVGEPEGLTQEETDRLVGYAQVAAKSLGLPT